MRSNLSQENNGEVSDTLRSDSDVVAMEEERHRLARELHDGPLQALTSMAFRIEVCQQLSTRNQRAALQHELSQLTLDLQRSISDIRQLMSEWRSSSWNGDDLRDVIAQYVREYEDGNGIEVSLDLEGLLDDTLHPEQKVAIFRVLQEALRNASRHSEGTRVWVEARLNASTLQICVRDDGKGFNILNVMANYPRQGLGVAGMQERARALGGKLDIDSRPGQGTNVILTIPWNGSHDQVAWSSDDSRDHAARVWVTTTQHVA